MTAVAKPKITFNVTEAAAATGYSIDVIRRAVRAGDLKTVAPVINGRQLARSVIIASDLERWVNSGGAS